MRVLFVTNAIPFPARNGAELTHAHLIEGLARRHEVDVAVVTRHGDVEYAARRANVPAAVRHVERLRLERQPALPRVLGEIAGTRPAFFVRGFRRDEVVAALARRSYDLLWAAPVGCLGLVDYCRVARIALPPHVALGLNDVKTTLYDNRFRQVLSGRLGWSTRAVLCGLRVPGLRRHERRYLGAVDLVHVQTEQERRRAERVLDGTTRKPRIIVGPCGRKLELERVEYRGRESERILFLTHLDGARSRESRWVLQKVWPLVLARRPQARLLLVGTPPPADSPLRQRPPAGVEILGYVRDLVSLYDSVALAIVPTLHATGISNRILDALTAGVPLVATPQSASTITGLTPGVHAAICSRAEEFAAEIVALLEDGARRERLSAASRAFGRLHPSWDDTVRTIIGAIESLNGAGARG